MRRKAYRKSFGIKPLRMIATGALVAALLLSSLLYAQDEVPLGDIARKIRAEKSAPSGSISNSSELGDGQNADSARVGQ